MNLPVAIGSANLIRVEQSQFTDAAPGERFYGPRANPADTDYRDVRVRQLCYRADAVKPVYSYESWVHAQAIPFCNQASLAAHKHSEVLA